MAVIDLELRTFLVHARQVLLPTDYKVIGQSKSRALVGLLS